MDDMLLAYLCCTLQGGACSELVTVVSSTAWGQSTVGMSSHGLWLMVTKTAC